MNQALQAKRRDTWYGELASAMRADLFRYAYWLSADRQVAVEVVQEIWVHACRARDRVQDQRAARQSLVAIARREHRRQREGKGLEVLEMDALVAREEPVLAATQEPEVVTLRRALLQLEEGDREPLVLQLLFEYSAEEIATQMGISTGAVLARLFRARNRLRKVLQG